MISELFCLIASHMLFKNEPKLSPSLHKLCFKCCTCPHCVAFVSIKAYQFGTDYQFIWEIVQPCILHMAFSFAITKPHAMVYHWSHQNHAYTLHNLKVHCKSEHFHLPKFSRFADFELVCWFLDMWYEFLFIDTKIVYLRFLKIFALVEWSSKSVKINVMCPCLQ